MKIIKSKNTYFLSDIKLESLIKISTSKLIPSFKKLVEKWDRLHLPYWIACAR